MKWMLFFRTASWRRFDGARPPETYEHQVDYAPEVVSFHQLVCVDDLVGYALYEPIPILKRRKSLLVEPPFLPEDPVKVDPIPLRRASRESRRLIGSVIRQPWEPS